MSEYYKMKQNNSYLSVRRKYKFAYLFYQSSIFLSKKCYCLCYIHSEVLRLGVYPISMVSNSSGYATWHPHIYNSFHCLSTGRTE